MTDFHPAAYDGVDLASAASLERAGLPPPFAARRGYAHATWARTFGSRPELWVQPATVDEVVAAVRLARHRRRRVATTGCGHSPSDMTCTSGWLVNLDRLNRVVDVDKATRLVTVEAGIRLRDLSAALKSYGLALPNLGSINAQSLAGACATGTHGSSLRHGLLSDDVVALAIVLGDGSVRRVGRDDVDTELFRAALLSVGALGIVVEMTIRAVPAFRLRWSQTVDTDAAAFAAWRRGDLWAQAHFVRVWWFPYTRRAVVWAAEDCPYTAAEKPDVTPRTTSFCDSTLGYLVYHNLLALGRHVPRILPWVEWFVFGLQYGFGTGPGRARVTSGLQSGDAALLMNCLYAQSVNEWALPLARGPEALARLGAWLNRLQPGDPGYVEHGIPFSAEGLYVHAPVEVRVADTSTQNQDPNTRPWLDPTCPDSPTLYLNAIMYRPYHRDVPGVDRYYEAFEWLMRDLGGRPHWAKCFRAGHAELQAAYGERLARFNAVRAAADPDGVFVGPWQRRLLLGEGVPPLRCEEVEVQRTTGRDHSVVIAGEPSSADVEESGVLV